MLRRVAPRRRWHLDRVLLLLLHVVMLLLRARLHNVRDQRPAWRLNNDWNSGRSHCRAVENNLARSAVPAGRGRYEDFFLLRVPPAVKQRGGQPSESNEWQKESRRLLARGVVKHGTRRLGLTLPGEVHPTTRARGAAEWLRAVVCSKSASSSRGTAGEDGF